MVSTRPDRAVPRWRPARALTALACGVLALSAVAGCDTDEAEVASAAPVPGAGVPVEQVAAEHGGAVWRVETEGCGWAGFGSAFVVDAHRLVTNHHVIANDTSPTIRSRDGEVREGRVIGADPGRDIAVIEVEEPLGAALQWAPTPTLQTRERLVVLGYPRPDHVFTVSYGAIVAFGGAGGADDVVVADAPIDRGNSGGPALRGDGSVVGVVTRVVLDDPTEHLAIVYPTDRVIAVVEAAVDSPRDVLSDCGFGPDYVPPVPEGIDITEPLPPPSPDITATTTLAGRSTSTTTASRRAPSITTGPPSASEPAGPARTTTSTAPSTSASVPPTTAPCPQRGVEASVVERRITPDDDGRQRIEVQGTVSNRGDARVVVLAVRVTFSGAEPVVVEATPEATDLEPGSSTTWEAAALVPDAADTDPPPATAVEWRWDDPGLAGCPAGVAP